jgi:hypothetical protein
VIAALRSWWRGRETSDGFGQSFADDLRYRRRFRDCRKRAVSWRTPAPEERARWDAHPIVGRFGDVTLAVADVDGRAWVVRENDWYGWPDPNRYPFFVLEGETIWAATDFNAWPAAWGPEPRYSV